MTASVPASAPAGSFESEVDRINLQRLRIAAGWTFYICLAQMGLNAALPDLRVARLGWVELGAALIFGGLWWVARRASPSDTTMWPVIVAAVTTQTYSVFIFHTVMERLGPNVAFSIGTLTLALLLLWRGVLLIGIVLLSHIVCSLLILTGGYTMEATKVTLIGNSFAVLFSIIASRMLLRAKRAEFEAHQIVVAQNRHLEELNREKDELMAVVAHDLRGPLGTLAQIADMAAVREPGLSELGRSGLKEVSKTAKQMRELVSELLETHQIETASHPTPKEVIDLESLLTDLQAQFNPKATGKRQTLVVEALVRGTPILKTDKTSLRRILGNLLENAIKFSPLGGEIILSVGVADDRMHFRVEDSGPGIPPKEFPKLFRKFGRLSTRPTAGESSTGLGLYASQQLAQRLGGELTAKNRREIGALFQLSLPLRPRD